MVAAMSTANAAANGRTSRDPATGTQARFYGVDASAGACAAHATTRGRGGESGSPQGRPALRRTYRDDHGGGVDAMDPCVRGRAPGSHVDGQLIRRGSLGSSHRGNLGKVARRLLRLTVFRPGAHALALRHRCATGDSRCDPIAAQYFSIYRAGARAQMTTPPNRVASLRRRKPDVRETVAGMSGRIRVHPNSFPLVLEPAIASFSPARAPYKVEQSTPATYHEALQRFSVRVRPA
jgi:hypothetical protein